MKKVTRAVITAAGHGTRMHPITRAVPKSMLPIVDAPVVYYLVSEAIKSGITDILVIVGERDSSIERFFSEGESLSANVSFAYQEEASGLAHAVRLARDFASDEPFVVLYGDDVISSLATRPHPRTGAPYAS